MQNPSLYLEALYCRAEAELNLGFVRSCEATLAELEKLHPEHGILECDESLVSGTK
jgi:hypothetical protein